MATVLADFIQIVGDGPIDVSQTQGGNEFPLPSFNTGGRLGNQTALLVFSVRDLSGSADVRINDVSVGTITATSPGIFSTQLITLDGNKLNDGTNRIVLKNVSDNFKIKDLICFFHQST